MKYKKMQKRLAARIAWWMSQSESFKHSTTKPGSVKGR